MVFVLDRNGKPLMPCSEKRARLLLARGRAVVHRRVPFVIRLRDRTREHSAVQPVVLKFDPGSRTAGVAVVREEQPPAGVVQHALHLAEVEHRGEAVHKGLETRAAYRRRRRAANLRYRPPRFSNRRRPAGWLPPSLRSRVDNLLVWTARYRRWAPVVRVDLELAKFDTQQLENPEIQGVEYQEGTLAGYEVRAYVREKFNHRCAYCHRGEVPFELDHIVPRSRGGSWRVSNLALACHVCNQEKGARTAAEYGHPEVQAQAQQPLKDAAAINSTRWAVCNGLVALGLSVACWTGGRTAWNRKRFAVAKTHAHDALCVGDLAGVTGADLPRLRIRATGRGQHCRTLNNQYGFPRAYLTRQKRIRGFQTGDLVRAVVPHGKYAGTRQGRVAIRARGGFVIGGADVSARYCSLLQRADGYEYHFSNPKGGSASPAASSRQSPPRRTDGYAGSSSDFGSRKRGVRSTKSSLPAGNQAYRLRSDTVTETITVTEIARELGVTTRHVINLIHAGRLPGAEKINALPNAPYLVPRTSFDALLRARREGRRSQTAGKTR